MSGDSHWSAWLSVNARAFEVTGWRAALLFGVILALPVALLIALGFTLGRLA